MGILHKYSHILFSSSAGSFLNVFKRFYFLNAGNGIIERYSMKSNGIDIEIECNLN